MFVRYIILLHLILAYTFKNVSLKVKSYQFDLILIFIELAEGWSHYTTLAKKKLGQPRASGHRCVISRLQFDVRACLNFYGQGSTRD